jgi:8-oxo-dGTP diphosphatase
MDNFRIAVKSFILNDKNEVLLIKRRDKDVHKPGAWEIPGGRLEIGENPFDGLKRETKEEVGLDIEIKNPIKVNHFVRDDGQKITMLVFLCRPLSDNIVLSEEHTEFVWLSLNEAKENIHPAFREDIEIVQRYFLNK